MQRKTRRNKCSHHTQNYNRSVSADRCHFLRQSGPEFFNKQNSINKKIKKNKHNNKQTTKLNKAKQKIYFLLTSYFLTDMPLQPPLPEGLFGDPLPKIPTKAVWNQSNKDSYNPGEKGSKSFQEHFRVQLCTEVVTAQQQLCSLLFQLYGEFNYCAAQCRSHALSMKPKCCPQSARKAVPLLCPQLCSGCRGWTEKHTVNVTYRAPLEKHSARLQAVQDALLNPNRPNTLNRRHQRAD